MIPPSVVHEEMEGEKKPEGMEGMEGDMEGESPDQERMEGEEGGDGKYFD